MFKWAARLPIIRSLSPYFGVRGKAAMMGALGGVVTVAIGALTSLNGLGPWSYLLLGAPGVVFGVILYLIAHELHHFRASTTARGAPEERTNNKSFAMDRQEDTLAARWAARCSPLMSLPQRHGFLGKAVMMGVFGAVVAVVIGAFTGTEKLIGPLSYVFLAALGGALSMVLYLIAHEVTRSRSATKAHGTEEERR